jgi:membrane-associated phospholipid phosphatase
MAFALAVLVVLQATRWRWALAIAVVAWAVAVGVSRVYLGVHFPSDVLAGWAIAACVVGVCWLLFWTLLEPDRPDAGLEANGRRPEIASAQTGRPAGGDALSVSAGTEEPTQSDEE